MVTTGTVLDGLYRLDRRVGRGAFGQVYLATDLRLKRSVAVKVLYPHLIEDGDEFLAMFEREAQTVAALDHPHILPVYYYGQFEDTPFLVMPYIDGGTLADKLAREHRLGVEQAFLYLRQAAAALDYAHGHKIVHRDIKPQNMLLRDNDAHLLLADFGVARLLGSTGALTMTRVIGSPAYMAPEQFGGQVGYATDIYALGCVFFHLLTGTPPYLGTAHELAHSHTTAPVPSLVERGGAHLPASLQAIVDRALAKRPEVRFQSAGELASAVQALIVAGPRSRAAPRKRSPRLDDQAKTPVEVASSVSVAADQPTILATISAPKREKAAPWAGLGLELLQLERWEGALAAYAEALRLDPTSASAWANKAVALNNLHHDEEALIACVEALRRDPAIAFAWATKGEALKALGRSEAALVACEEALRLDPLLAWAWETKGAVLHEIGRSEAALAACEEALRLDSGYAQAWCMKGMLLNELGRPEAALAACEEALLLDPNLEWAWAEKAVALNALGRPESALAACEEALRLDHGYAQSWATKGAALLDLGRRKEGMVAYKKRDDLMKAQ